MQKIFDIYGDMFTIYVKIKPKETKERISKSTSKNISRGLNGG
jgi:hypothetical protein